MTGPPEVSLVMPAWDTRRDWLLAAVDSALGQRGCDFELIVVDDGCTEPLTDVLRDVTDTRLRILRTERRGPYRARNTGIAAARGRFIRFVDADDVLDPDSTRRLLDSGGGRDDVIAYGDTILCDETLAPTGALTSTLTGDAEVACLLDRFAPLHVSMLLPRAVVDATGEWDDAFKVMGDWDFVLRALQHAPVVPAGAVAAYYRVHQHSFQSLSSIEEAEDAWRRIVERFVERHPHHRGRRVHRRALAVCHAHFARVYERAGRHGRYLDRLWRQARLDPIGATRTVSWLLRRNARAVARRPRAGRATVAGGDG